MPISIELTIWPKPYRDGYVYDGQYSAVRQKLFGRKPGTTLENSLLSFQNHDQIGNRKLGERSSTLYSYEALKLLAER